MPTLRLPMNLPGLKGGWATVLRWLVKPGQELTVGDLLVELELEDSLLQIESPVKCTASRFLVEPGKTIAPGSELAEITIGQTVQTTNLQPTGTVPMPDQTTGGKVTPILMPQAGNTMEEGRILQWKVKVGDRVSVGQVLFEVETDKANVEVEATEAGRLARIIAPEGAVVPVKQPVAYLAENDADVDAYLSSGQVASVPSPAAEAASPTETSPAPVPQAVSTSDTSERIKASPAARKLAAQLGVELSAVGAGSGPGGRILSTDLDRKTAPTTPMQTATSGDAIRRPMSKMRRAIAVNLQTSKQTIPHFYLKQTIVADPLFQFYREQKPATGCTLNDVVLLALGKTIAEFPAFRSRIEGEHIVELPNANIGVAVSVDDGLVVPVVLAVEKHTLASLSAQARKIIEAARQGKLENIGKGIFTITNMGMLGVEDFTPIINPPESGILGVSAVRESVIVKDGAIRAGRVMNLTLSVDHRIIDGAMAAAFMMKLKQRLENPKEM